MEMTYGGALVMPSSYAMMDEEEMTYLEGGAKLIISVAKDSFTMLCLTSLASWAGYKATTAALLAVGTTIATSIELGTAGMGTLIAGAFILALYAFAPKLVSLAITYGAQKTYGQKITWEVAALKKDFKISI